MDFEMQLSMAGIHPDFAQDKKSSRKAVGVSRKDTIIIAMLVNIALLAVLFATASRQTHQTIPAKVEPIVAYFETVSQTHSQQSQALQNQNKLSSQLQASANPTESTVKEPIDEIDELLKSYALKSVKTTLPSEKSQNIKTVELATQTQISTPVAAKSLSQPHYTEIKVKKGDVLSRIARQHNVKVEDIIVLNGLESANVKIGQVLKVPVAKSLVAKSQSSQKPATEQIPEYYVVKEGDSPWKIAKKCRIGVEDLLRLNNLNEEKARNLKIGQKLRIR